MDDAAIEVRDVHRTFMVSVGAFRRRQALHAVNGVSLQVRRGEVLALVGESGCGKTTLARMLLGLLRPSGGKVFWTGGPDAMRQQAMVFQRPVLMRRSAAANLEFAMKLRGLGREERRKRCEKVMLLTGLTELAERPARVLSAGEQQRLAVARAWAIRPQVLFLDEPTASLDPTATRAVETIVSAIHESGTKVIMTTHDLGQARRLAEEVVFLHRGRLIEQGPAEAFFTEPRTPLARAFLNGELIW